MELYPFAPLVVTMPTTVSTIAVTMPLIVRPFCIAEMDGLISTQCLIRWTCVQTHTHEQGSTPRGKNMIKKKGDTTQRDGDNPARRTGCIPISRLRIVSAFNVGERVLDLLID